jgi:hypothetical protein
MICATMDGIDASCCHIALDAVVLYTDVKKANFRSILYYHMDPLTYA